MYKRVFKRLIDLAFATVTLALLSPVLILVTLLLWRVTDGKPFFLQMRPGRNGRLFKIVKFRTMTDQKDATGELLPDAMRITPIGGFVRRTSLDEVPQLINVLKGDMSLIGPRPLLVEYLPLYNNHQARRHEVRPGVTGWAQVNGRNTVAWTQKFEYDVWYVDNLCFSLDMRIMFYTVKKVLMREGISQDGRATVDVFKGESNE